VPSTAGSIYLVATGVAADYGAHRQHTQSLKLCPSAAATCRDLPHRCAGTPRQARFAAGRRLQRVYRRPASVICRTSKFEQGNSFADELRETARYISSPGKGILASDESNATTGKRLASVGVENTEDNRCAWRQTLYTAPGLGQYISGAATLAFRSPQRVRTASIVVLGRR
jgi:Fructose-bisphosphate aldolase class-I